MNNLYAISRPELDKFANNETMGMSAMDLHSASSMKEQSMERHVAPRR